MIYDDMGVSKNRGIPKSSILIGFSIINHPFWGTTISGNTHMMIYALSCNTKKKHVEIGPSPIWKMIKAVLPSTPHSYQREKLGTHGRIPEIYTNMEPPIYGLYNGFMGQYGVFWEQLLGYLPKGTQNFPLILGVDVGSVEFQDGIVVDFSPFDLPKVRF